MQAYGNLICIEEEIRSKKASEGTNEIQPSVYSFFRSLLSLLIIIMIINNDDGRNDSSGGFRTTFEPKQ